MKQTAVEWLAEQINIQDTGLSYYYFKQMVKQAKELEKKQIIESHNNGKNILHPNENGEQYYKDNYGR